jgi:hypothetical protein
MLATPLGRSYFNDTPRMEMATTTSTSTREPADVVAHIFYAVGNTDSVTVTSVFGDFTGELRYPEGEDGVVIGTRGAKPPPLVAGAPICVEYAGRDDSYRFYSEVLEVHADHVVATLPYAVEGSNDRRLTPRIDLTPASGFAMRLLDEDNGKRIPLVDISVGGFSFADPSDEGLAVGTFFDAELLLPGEAPIRCSCEVRNLFLRRARLRIGARLAAMSIRDRGRLARFLVRWQNHTAAHSHESLSPLTNGGE